MKANIHPALHTVKVVCSCGNSFETQSTKDQLHVEVCYKCHPFYTGEHRFVDSKGRVDSFQKKQQKAIGYKKVSRKDKKEQKEEKKVKTLKELLNEG